MTATTFSFTMHILRHLVSSLMVGPAEDMWDTMTTRILLTRSPIPARMKASAYSNVASKRER